MATPREHIEEIRRKKFSIGGEPNPLTEDLHHAVKNLSAELYAKDVHFLMELIQNAEDNEYLAGANPSLEFIITSKDITAMGASATLLIFNNEKGFSNRNIDSICSVGRSTKKGKRQNGYIGEKGIGFKSVFLVTSQPYIFSNGYQIRFNEEPNQDCQIGYVVPEWVDENPTLADIQQIYGSTKILPTTTIILPLKSEKVAAVKQQLSSLHPEVLLFLSKIKRLSVKEENADPQLNTVSAISISSEMDLKTRKNIDAESYTLHLSAEENEDEEKECSYYMWKQKFPVALRSRVGRRMEIEEWAITLAFPFGERLDRNLVSSPGIYMFLPTEMVTNFPFIIQADFVLASSRETILLDNEWNKGILECVPSAFINAFVSLVKTVEAAPASSLPQLFKFLPVKNSLYPELNTAREKIREKVITEHIVPCESSTEQKILCRPHEACRLLPDFWNVLNKAMSSGLSVHSLSSHGACILNSAFDKAEFDEILSFLEVPYVNDDWYAKCIQSSNLVLGVPEYVYVRLLCFLVYNWNHCFIDIPILKYVDQDGKVDSRSLRRASLRSDRICLSSEVDQIPWLIKWSKEFRCAVDTFFMPESTQKALRSLSNWEIIRNWLKKYACVKEMTVYSYGILLVNALNETRPLIAFNPFLYHSFYRNYLSESEVSRLCNSMPVIDNYGVVKKVRTGILVPATVSKWMELMGSNPWRGEKLVELSSKYVSPGNFGDICINGDQLMSFLKTYMKALDIPEICPPNAAFQTASSPLTKKNAFLLLDWIRNLKYKGISFPEKFLRCIREGSWLKTRLGYKPPSESFLSSLEWGNLVQMGSVLVDIPLIDEKFYDDNISSYKEELKMMGVMVEPGEACAYIAKRLMSLAASSRLTRENVFSVLRLINFLRETYLSPKEFIDSVKDGKWLKTSLGERSPAESVLFDSEWEAVSKISQLPFIDEKYYGKEIHNYRSELQLLGVEVGFDQNYLLVADNLKLPAVLATLTRDSVLLILGCIRSTSASEHLVRTLKDQSWLKTNLGFKVPAESFLFDPQWGCLLQIVDGIPLIDENFYGSSSLRSYKDELKQVGVVVNFEEASKAVSHRFKQASSSMTLKRENVLSLLECYKHLKAVNLPLPRELVACIHEQKWLKTHLGYKSPHESILFDSEWESISPIASLPFIDDTHYGKIIYTYRDEIEALGVVVKFKQGVRFVAAGLNLPANPVEIALGSALSLLECIKILREEGSSSLSEELVKSVDKEWLKTHMGYRSPKECLLFDSNWGSFLQQEDGPFIDEAFYGDRISSYRDELRAMGVVVDTKDWCPLLANHLEYHSQLPVITRIYEYLSNFNWQPEDKSNCWIWIPNGSSEGEWVSPDECALHDKDNLFSLQLDVLEKYYDKKLLSFFSSAFKVAHSPTTEDYCELWKDWEIGQHQVTEKECCSFWEYITKHWNSRTENHLMSGMSKLPVNTVSGEIQLSHKQEVFIPDDLFLKDLFGKAFPEPIFVWYPQPSLPSLSLSKLYDIYKSIGVRTISESIRKNEFSAPSNVELRKIKRSNGLIGEGLLRIILAYLADPCFEMPVDRRHRIIQSLLDLTVFIMVEPVAWSYCLPLSSGKTLSVKASKMVRWERNSSKLLVHNFNKKNHKAKIEFATCFSESISEGLLWENTDRIADLCELIKLGCLLQFEVDAVKFLLKTKKLQLFVEDEEFLSSAFPSDQGEPKPVIE